MKEQYDSVKDSHQTRWHFDHQQTLDELAWKLRNVDDPKVIIQSVLQTALEFYDADRAYVLEVDRELNMASNTYECCAPGVTPVIDMLQQLPFEPYPRWNDAFTKLTPILIQNLDKLRCEYPDEYHHMKMQEITSLLAVPFSRKIIEGFLGVDNPRRYGNDPNVLFMLSYAISLELCETRLMEAVKIVQQQSPLVASLDLYINLLGRFEIKSSNGTLRDGDFSNEAAYNLLTYLILNRKKSYSVRAIAETIWENSEIADPYAAVKNVVYKLRNTLDLIGIRDFIVASHGTFSLNPIYRIYIDAERFEDACKRIPYVTNPDMLNQLYESVIDLYKGSLLPRYDSYHWLMPRIVYYHNLYVHRMKEYVALLYERQEYVAVQKLAAEVLSIDIYATEMHYYLITAVYKCGNKKLATMYFKQASDYLDDDRKQELSQMLS